MKVVETSIPDLKIFEPTVYGDERGFFYESFNQKIFKDVVGSNVNFIQDNHSKSCRGVLRGLHYQMPPYAQAKLVRCIVGEVFDVAVDVRQTSPYFGQWVGVHLSAKNKRQFWIPEGFAHGFLTLSDNAEFVYKTTNHYNKESEAGVIWNDSVINIDWPLGDLNILLSQKDVDLPIFPSARYF